jgi:hypothetical protein
MWLRTFSIFLCAGDLLHLFATFHTVRCAETQTTLRAEDVGRRRNVLLKLLLL